MAMKTIANKHVIVTGGSRGIGLGLVERLLARNNTVVATSRSPEVPAPLQQLQLHHGKRLKVAQLDTAHQDSIDAWATSMKNELPHVDVGANLLVLINCAGVYGKRASLGDYSAADFTEVFATNAVGPFLVVQQLHSAGLLGRTDHSLVVNVTSIVASLGDTTVPGGGSYPYRASKAALNVINKSLAADLADDNVACLAMHPGYVRGTGMTGENGYIDISESAGGILQVLESGVPLNNRFLAYNGRELLW